MFICVDLNENEVIGFSETKEEFIDWLTGEFGDGRIPPDYHFFRIEEQIYPKVRMTVAFTY